MDKRKAIVIAVVLFLLIGLGTFVFANPTQRGLEGDNTGNTTQGGSESVDDNTDGKEENANEEQDEENDEPVISVIDDGNNNTENGDGNSTTNNGGSAESDNSAYLAALAALEKAEESFLQSDLDYANSLIDALQDNEDKSDLVNRANVVQEVIDVETLVKNLQNQVNTAQNIDNVNSARDYREDEEIVNKVTALENSSKKEELEAILVTVAKILDDKEAPSISGIDDGVVTSLDITLKVTDDNAVKVYVNGTETTFEDLQNMKFTEAKDYEVVVVDAAYNEAKLSFAKDVTAPEFNVNDGYKTKDNIDVVVTETHLDRVEVTNETTGEKATYTTNEFTLTNEGVYTLVAFDKANLTKEIKVEIDKTAPNGYDVGILNVTHYREENPNLGYAKVDDEIRVIVHFKEQLATLPTLSINGVLLENEFFYAEESSNVTKNDYVYMADVKLDAEFIQKVSLVDGDIKFTISGYADAVGNVGAELTNANISENANYPSVEFDSVKPILNFNNGMITSSFTVEVTEDNFDYMIVKPLGGTEVKVTEKTYEISGNEDNLRYEITVYDKAGNVSEYRSIYLDNHAPEVEATGYNGNEVPVENGKKYQKVHVKFTDGSLKKVVLLNEDGSEKEVLKTEDDNYYLEKLVYEKTFEEEGTYIVRAIDRNNQETTITFTIDKTDPLKDKLQINNNSNSGSSYIKIGDTLRINFTTNEILGTLPTLTVGTQEPVSFKQISGGNGEIIYQADIVITGEGLEQGTLAFKISGYADLAGNVGLELSEKDANTTLTFDSINPNVRIFRVQNFQNPYKNENYATLGDKIAITVNSSEPIVGEPVIVVGGKEYNVPVQEIQNNKYVVYIELTEELQLTNGEKIEFTIKGLTDLAGNVGEDITSTGDDNYYVIFDSEPADLVNIRFNSNNENKTMAKLGDQIGVYLNVDEELGENPKFKINDKEYTMNQTGVNNGVYMYAVVTEVNEEFAEGPVSFEISNIVDKAGNKLDKVFTINDTEERVTVDNTPATRDYSTLYFEETGKVAYDVDGYKTYYMKNGDSVIFRIAFHEELNDVPTVTIGGQNVEMTSKGLFQNNDGEDIYVYEGTFKIAEDEATMTEGMLEIKLSNVVDLAGNVATDEAVLNQTPTSNNRVMIYDRTLEDYEIIFHSSNANNTSAKIGDYIGVYFIVNEELKQNPTFTLNGKEYKVNQTEVNGNRYKYAVVVPVTEDFLEGDVTFTITNIVDKAGNQYPDLSNDDVDTTVTIDNTAPIFDLSKIADTFEVGVDTYIYPQPGIVTDNIDGNISFGEVHMQWFKKTADGEKGEETTCFGGDNWNTGLTNCDLGTYIVTYKVYDKAGNEAYAEKEITLQDTTNPGFKPSYFEKTVELNRNGVFTDYPIVEGTDNTNGPVTVEKIGEDVDITKVGDYYIRYKVTDASGNSATNKVFVHVRDTKAPELVVDGLTNDFTTSSNVAIHAVDQSNFKIVVKRDGKVVRDQDPGTLNSNNVFGVWFGLTDAYGDGHFEVIATDEYNNSVTIEFDRIMISLADQDVGSNPINADGSFGIFNSFAIKFNRDLTFTNYSLTNGFKIEMEYSVDGGNTYKKSGTVINNSWTGTLGNSTTSKYEGSTFTVTAGSPIYWNGTSVSTRYKEIYDAILATEGTENEVYVRTVFTVIQPTYTKSFALDPVIYSDGGQTVSPQGLAQF